VSTLKEILLSDANRAQVVREAAQLVDSEVGGKKGMSGIAIKAGYKTVKTVKPGLVPEAVDSLLDRFVERLEPFFSEWDGAGRSGGFDGFLSGKKNQVANALLGVTDDRAKVVANRTVKKAYEKLRPQGEKNVEEAVPGLGRLIAKYL